MQKRIEWLDSIKGFAMIMVVLGHCGTNNFFYTALYNIHLPLFISVSGYLLAIKNESNSKISKSIFQFFKALMYPYFGLGIATLVYHYFVHIMYGTGFNLKDEIWLILIFENGANWFLPVLFFSKCICYVAFKSFRKTKYKILIFALVSALISWIIKKVVIFYSLETLQGSNLFDRSLYMWIVLVGKVGVFCYFIAIGYFLYIIKCNSVLTEFIARSKQYFKILLPILSLMIILIGCFSPMVDLHYNKWEKTIPFFLVSTLAVIFIIVTFEFLNIHGRILTWIGSKSLVINGTHLNFDLVNISSKLISDIMPFASNIYTVTPFVITLFVFLFEVIFMVPCITKVFPYIISLPRKSKKNIS